MIEPVAIVFGGRSKAAAGWVSLPPTEPALKPMPRLAKTCQMALSCLPWNTALSATRIALRMSMNDGLYGASSIARVTKDSAFLEPRRSRRSQRVWAQISPSACTSAPPATLA